MATLVGTGNQTLSGTATGDAQADTFTLYGQGNIVDTYGGSEVINGGSTTSTGWDNATAIHIGSTPSAAPPSNAGVTDSVIINGGNDTLTGDGTLIDEAKSYVAGRTVTAAVAVFDAANVSFTINGQGSTIGGDYVGLDNVGGSTTIALDGPSDVIYANDDATNTISVGAAGGHTYVYLGSPEIGSPENLGAGFSSSITLEGDGNYLFGGEANHTVTIGGTGAGSLYSDNDDITLGNGNNTITVTGEKNQIIVGSGSNTINAGNGNALVALEFFGRGSGTATDAVTLGGGFNQVYAPQAESLVLTGGPGGSNVVGPYTGGGVTYTANGNDSVTLIGASNSVVLGNGMDSVVLTNTYGANAVTLGNGNDSVIIDTSGNTVTLGNGNDAVMLHGGGNAITIGNGNDNVTLDDGGNNVVVGNGNDNVFIGGGGNDITVGGGSDSLTIVGSFTTSDVVVDAMAASRDTLTLGGYETIGLTVNGSGASVAVAGTFGSIGLGGGSGNTLAVDGTFETVTLGSVSDTLIAQADFITFIVNGAANDSDMLSLSSYDYGTITGATCVMTFAAFDSLTLVGLQAGSTLALGTYDTVSLSGNADAKATFADSGVRPGYSGGDTLTINGSGAYTGSVELTNFSTLQTLDLEGLYGTNGARLNSMTAFASNLATVAGKQVVSLQGGGTIIFDGTSVPGGFTTADLRFS